MQRKQQPLPNGGRGCKKGYFFEKKLYDWVRAEVFALAGLAVAAYPQFVKLIHGLLNDSGGIGEDSCLEVALVASFHADASTCEVGTADIYLLAIEDQHLEVHTRTQHPLQTVIQHRIAVKVLAEVWSRFLGMNEPNLNATTNQQGDNSKKRLRCLTHLHMQVLNVGRANPQTALHTRHLRQHLVVVVYV